MPTFTVLRNILCSDLNTKKLFVNEKDGKTYMVPLEKYGKSFINWDACRSESGHSLARPYGFKALNQLVSDAEWGALDYMLIDLPPGTGDIHLTLVSAVPLTGAVIVSTPQHVALADARKGISMFQMPQINVLFSA